MRNKVAVLTLAILTIFTVNACLWQPPVRIPTPAPPPSSGPPVVLPDTPLLGIIQVHQPQIGQVKVKYDMGSPNGHLVGIQYRIDDGAWINFEHAADSLLVVKTNPNTGLPFAPGRSHGIHLRVANENGWGPMSPYRSFNVPRPTPLIPIMSVGEVGSRSAIVDVADTFRAEGFRFAVADMDAEEFIQGGEITGSSGVIRINDLKPSTNYGVLVSGLNEWGVGLPGVVEFTTTNEAVLPAASLSVAPDGTVTVEAVGLPSDATGWIVVGTEHVGPDTTLTFDEYNVIEIGEGVTNWDDVEDGVYLVAVAYYTGTFDTYVIVHQEIITVRRV